MIFNEVLIGLLKNYFRESYSLSEREFIKLQERANEIVKANKRIDNSQDKNFEDLDSKSKGYAKSSLVDSHSSERKRSISQNDPAKGSPDNKLNNIDKKV